jgi:uroporphyrinogen-III decarboxylase
MQPTSLERVMTVISGGIPDRVPTDLHNFLPAAKAAGINLSECLRSGELMAESQILAWRRFGRYNPDGSLKRG